MTVVAGPNQATIAGQVQQTRQQLQQLSKNHQAAINGAVAAVNQLATGLSQSLTTGTVTTSGGITLEGAQQITANGKQLYGYSASGYYPAGTGSSTFGGGAGCGSTAFNATAITDLEAVQALANGAANLANYLYQVLVDAGIIA